MRESWTDERLDDLNGKVDALRVAMRTEFAAVRGDMDRRFDKVDERFDKIDARFEVMDGRLHQIYQAMLGFCTVALAALIGLIATQI